MDCDISIFTNACNVYISFSFWIVSFLQLDWFIEFWSRFLREEGHSSRIKRFSVMSLRRWNTWDSSLHCRLLRLEKIYTCLLNMHLGMYDLVKFVAKNTVEMYGCRSMTEWHRRGRLRKYGQKAASSKDDSFCGFFSSTLLNIKSLYASKDGGVTIFIKPLLMILIISSLTPKWRLLTLKYQTSI